MKINRNKIRRNVGVMSCTVCLWAGLGLPASVAEMVPWNHPGSDSTMAGANPALAGQTFMETTTAAQNLFLPYDGAKRPPPILPADNAAVGDRLKPLDRNEKMAAIVPHGDTLGADDGSAPKNPTWPAGALEIRIDHHNQGPAGMAVPCRPVPILSASLLATDKSMLNEDSTIPVWSGVHSIAFASAFNHDDAFAKSPCPGILTRADVADAAPTDVVVRLSLLNASKLDDFSFADDQLHEK